MIKSFPNGISVVLDPDTPFDILYTEMARKFRDSARFFGNAKMIVSFEGRALDIEEERLLVNSISDNTELTILCVMGSKDSEQNQQYLKTSDKFFHHGENNDGQFYKGTLRAGQVLETDSSVIILGDVNPGADVISTGNIVILGTLYGHACAGANGNSDCFIVALDMKPSKIQIGDYSTKTFVRGGRFLKNKQAPRIAYVLDEEIITDIITNELLSSMDF